jgi:hypothetical protein
VAVLIVEEGCRGQTVEREEGGSFVEDMSVARYEIGYWPGREVSLLSR